MDDQLRARGKQSGLGGIVVGAAGWLGCTLILVLAVTSPRPMEGIAGAFFLVAMAGIALPSIIKSGLYSLGSVTLAIAVVPFLLKWLLNSRPASPRIQAFDNDRAMLVSGLFFGCLFIGYRLRFKSLKAKSDCMRPRLVPSALLAVLAIVGFLSVGLRHWLAAEFAIGVPGLVPHAPTGFGSLFGILYYIGAYLPLGVVLMLFLGRRANHIAPVAAAVAILTMHALVGANIGSRGSVAFAVGIFFLGVAWGPRSSGKSRIGAIIAGAVVGALAMRYGVSKALASRESGIADENSPVAFVLGRIGGLDYVSPIVSVLDDNSLLYLQPGAWNRFLNERVYHLPVGVTNGSAASLPGWVLGFGGLLGLVIVGFACGIICGQLDRRVASQLSDPVDRLRQAAMLLLWSILLLEGNLIGAAYAGAALFALAAVMSVVLSGNMVAIRPIKVK